MLDTPRKELFLIALITMISLAKLSLSAKIRNKERYRTESKIKEMNKTYLPTSVKRWWKNAQMSSKTKL